MNILTFDIEEWFHILDNESTRTYNEWNNYESRIYSNMEIIFEFLKSSDLKATFFVVGWIAEKYPDIIKKISNSGFEVGSHTNMHQLMYNQTKKEIEEDLKISIDTIESLIGKKVTSFRAPGFSITEKNKWVFYILAENGITHDSSIFPAGRAHGGFSSYPKQKPCIIEINGFKIKEFPINTYSFMGMKWIFSGGGYFRITPYCLVKKLTSNSDYVMTYFHPRDFDVSQPIIEELSLARKFKSYVGIKGCINKLQKWTNDFPFIDLDTADKMIDWSNVPVVKL